MKKLFILLSAIIVSITAGAQQSVTDGNKYVPYDQRTGNESVVYFTRNLNAEGFIKAYEMVNANITGKVAVKLHTGEKNGPNILPRSWVKALIEKDIPNASQYLLQGRPLYHGTAP